MNRNQANSVFSSNVMRLPKTSTRIVVFEPSRAWRDVVMQRLTELVQELEHGWDGYEGGPVSLENAMFALRMLEAVCGPAAPPPQLVPGPSGDLQIEWHTLGGDIELHVLAPNRVQAWRQTAGSDENGQSLELTFDFGPVAGWVGELSEPNLAAAIAAA